MYFERIISPILRASCKKNMRHLSVRHNPGRLVRKQPIEVPLHERSSSKGGRGDGCSEQGIQSSASEESKKGRLDLCRMAEVRSVLRYKGLGEGKLSGR